MKKFIFCQAQEKIKNLLLDTLVISNQHRLSSAWKSATDNPYFEVVYLRIPEHGHSMKRLAENYFYAIDVLIHERMKGSATSQIIKSNHQEDITSKDLSDHTMKQKRSSRAVIKKIKPRQNRCE